MFIKRTLIFIAFIAVGNWFKDFYLKLCNKFLKAIKKKRTSLK
jgi:hypothetical protein